MDPLKVPARALGVGAGGRALGSATQKQFQKILTGPAHTQFRRQITITFQTSPLVSDLRMRFGSQGFLHQVSVRLTVKHGTSGHGASVQGIVPISVTIQPIHAPVRMKRTHIGLLERFCGCYWWWWWRVRRQRVQRVIQELLKSLRRGRRRRYRRGRLGFLLASLGRRRASLRAIHD